MPFINVKTNTEITKNTADAMKSELGQAITAIPGKSEDWLMVEIQPERTLYFKGSDAPAAMVEVSVLGKENPSAFNVLTRKICDIIHENLSIEPSRIYVKYAATANWGWNGGNF